MASYWTIDEILKENKVLKEKIIQLENELTNVKKNNVILKETLSDRNNEDAVEILEFFHSCSSIRRTAWKFGMDMEEMYELIPQWDGCRDGLQSADDYEECRIEVVGRQEWDSEQEAEMTADEKAIRDRTPDAEEMSKITADYTDSSLSMYELADKYNLTIYNLFRLLKENNLIEKETDAKQYAGFYVDFNGAGSEWDGKSEIGLL
jgi:hypothetical protein